MRLSSWRSAITWSPASVTSCGTPDGDWSAPRRSAARGWWSPSASLSRCSSATARGSPERSHREPAQPPGQGAGRGLGEVRRAALVGAAPHRGGAGAAVDLVRGIAPRSEEHTSELQSQSNLVCRLLLEKKNEL